jgi:hypothetical protein
MTHTACRAAGSPTPTSILATINLIGPRQTIIGLDKRGQWEEILNRISSGQKAWIALVPRLRAGSDAGSSEDLTISLAAALPKNPAAVLHVIGPDSDPVLGPSRVCGIPFIEQPKRQAALYERQVVMALKAVAAPDLMVARQKCLGVLSASEGAIETQ